MSVPPLVGIEFRDRLKERIEMHVRHSGLNRQLNPLMKPVDLDPQLVGALHRAVDRGVERRRVTACRQDADSLH